jgi:hypothetical protein
MVAKSSYFRPEEEEKDSGYVTKRLVLVNTIFQMIRGE